MNKNIIVVSIGITVVLIYCAQAYSFVSGRDHSKVSKGHVHATREFVEYHLMHQGIFNAYKVQTFIERLEKEKKSIKDDLFETAMLEKIELDIKSYKKARKNAKKKSNDKKSNILRGYDEYLIPKIKKLLTFVLEGKDQELCQALVDDFIRGYLPYYVPNAHRTIWPRDFDFLHNIKRLFKRYHFKKHDKKYVESNNLIVDSGSKASIATCLGNNFAVGEYLTAEQLNKLKECKIDISTLNPGVSALWQPVENREKYFIFHKNYFPNDDDKIHYDRVTYRGHTSPKLKVFYKKNDKEVYLKLKMGQEVHTDIVVSKLMELVGLNQDQMLYKKKVKVHLGKTSFEEFRSLYINKYGLESFVRYITAHGRESDEAWIILEDVLFETRENKELRVGPFDMTSWDLRNRREYRSLLLLWGWVSLNNIKLANFKFLYKDTPKGLKPLHRMHDAGSSLGGPTSLKKAKYVLSLIQYEKVNAFQDHFLGYKKKKDQIKINWNDFSHYKRYFKDSTWYDLKWMARKIAAISAEEIYQALLLSGMPLPVVDIYRIKLIKRRNEIVSAFSLENEYNLYPVPDLEDYNPTDSALLGTIKNGKVVQKVFPGKNNLVHVQETWFTFLQKLASFSLPISKWKDKKTGYEFQGALEGLEGLKTDIGIKEAPPPTAVTTLPIGVGVQAVLSRKVEPNIQLMNNGSRMHIYRIIDRLKLKIGLDSPLFKKLVDKVDYVDAHAGIKFYEYEVQYVHYHDHQKQAYLSKFRLPKILKNIAKFAAYKLNSLEYIKTYHRVGFELDIGVGIYSAKPLVRNEIGITTGIKKELSNYILRDEYGQLHVFIDETRNVFCGLNFGLADIDLFVAKLALLRFNKATSWFKHHQADYVFELPISDRRKTPALLNKARREQEYQTLVSLKKNSFKTNNSSFVKKLFDIHATGKVSKRGFGGFFVFHKEKQKSYSNVKVLLEKGEERKFYRSGVVRHKSTGISSKSIPLYDMLVSSRKKISNIIEIDQDDSDNFLFIIRVEDYYRVRKKEKLDRLIADVNRRFSKDQALPFYRNYILPKKNDLDKYRKVYALTRVFVEGKKFVEKIRAISNEKVLSFGKKHFWDDQLSFQNKDHKDPTFIQKLKINYRIKKLSKAVLQIKKCFHSPKKVCSIRTLARRYQKLFKYLHVETYGLHFLKHLLFEDGIFVMGDIAGVLPSYSGLQDLQQQQRRRFAGKSWGTYNIKPPLQKFLRYHRLVPPLVHIDKTLSDRYIFGELETALPPNLVALFGHETRF